MSYNLITVHCHVSVNPTIHHVLKKISWLVSTRFVFFSSSIPTCDTIFHSKYCKAGFDMLFLFDYLSFLSIISLIEVSCLGACCIYFPAKCTVKQDCPLHEQVALSGTKLHLNLSIMLMNCNMILLHFSKEFQLSFLSINCTKNFNTRRRTYVSSPF